MKTARENIVDTLTGKRVLFIENDNSLENGLELLEEILQTANIQYSVLFDISKIGLETVVAEIDKADAIVFQTTWLRPISEALSDFMWQYKRKMIVIECYISEPSWYYKPKNLQHDLYIYRSDNLMRKYHPDEADHFYKLSSTAYWDYKNNFDK